ncbi:MAG TPA: histidinol dehydrogenase [Solirubrobacteraceae bacterium]|nr:histidinol dehydrogenase [Solirubrobacteraceae bacterium]
MLVERLDAAAVQRLGGAPGAAAHLRSLVAGGESVEQAVRAIVSAVRERGDEALLEYTRRFDTDGAEPGPLVVTSEQLDRAIKQLPLDVVAGLQVAIANVAQVAQAGVGGDTTVQLPQGHQVTLRELPVRAAAVYVPGGRAPYPSTVVMGVVSARSAGVLEVVVCAPPGADGQVDPVILGTCRLLGVERVYAIGGAQAIAALTYGTDTVARVDVIVGPGNLYVQEAKRQLCGDVGIDGFAGPSDLLVVLGEDADVRLAALDLMAQAEHGTGSLVAAISTSPATLDALAQQLEQLTAQYPAVEPAACVLVQVDSARDAIALSNEFAPEHLELIGAEPEALASLVQSAGCVFVGAGSATAFGDYVAGSNHVLPTGGAARFASSLSVRHFRRRMSEVRIGERAVAKLAAAGAPIARAEGFELHAQSMQARIRENPGQ